MEDFTITISSADIMYYSAFVAISMLILLALVGLIYFFYYRCKRYKERKDREEAEKQKSKRTEDMLLRLRSNSDLGIKMLYNHVHKFPKAYDAYFIEAIDKEMKQRGLR